MAGTGGYFLQGLGTGLKTGFNMRMQKKEMDWKENQQKELDKKKKKLEDAALNYKSLVTQYGEDNTFTNEEISHLNTVFMGLGYEVQDIVKSTHENIQSMKTNRVKEDMEKLDMWAKWAENQTPENITESWKEVKDWAQSEKGKRLFKIEYNLLQKKVAPPEDVWGQAGSLPQDIRSDYLRSKGIDIPQVTEPSKEPSVANYNSAMNYLSKSVNADPDTFNKIRAGLQTKFGIDLSNITQESLKTPERAAVGGGVAPEAADLNDILFGTNGIMKNYIGSGSQLGEEQKVEIRNNYDLIKPTLPKDVRKQVEEYLGQIGIDVSKAMPEPEVVMDIKKKPFWQSDWKYYQGLTIEELYYLADKEDDQKAYEELKRRGKI